MKITHSKDKIYEQGRSQFVRCKLDAEYDPKVRTSKPQPMSYQQIPLKDRHEFISKEQNQICSHAIRQIKRGSCLVLDWNTRTNFRTTNSQLPRLNTEPIPPLDRSSRRNSCIASPIEEKRLQLARLLHHHHKKRYMQTKHQQQEEKLLFGLGLPTAKRKTSAQYLCQSSLYDAQLAKCRTKNKNIEQIQQSILSNSKLKIFKEDLKVKFQQIKQTYKTNKKKQRLRNFFNKNT